ncbi:MAG: VWA domain-containing protein [Acidobacteriaceae bacterium]
MRQGNNSNKVWLLTAIFAAATMLGAQQPAPTPTQRPTLAQPSTAQERDPIPSPDDVTPGVLAAPRTAAPANNAPNNGTAANVPSGPEVAQPAGSNTVSVNTPAAQQGAKNANGTYVFTANVNEVRLYATVVDQKQRLVTDLNQTDFRVYEDGQPQQITFFDRTDVPVALGIIIDNSGSMRDKREKVNDAALNLVRSSNPQDQVFIVNFNDEAFLDQQFTPDIAQLREGLQHVDSRGGTALYDAVQGASKYMIDSAAMLRRKGIVKRVLLVVTDGEDNESRSSLEDAIKYVQTENGPTIYTIGLLGQEHERKAKRALEELAVQTGGVSFFPRDLNEVDAISKAVAKDIRNQYLIRYKSSKPQSEGGYRTVKVEAQAPGFKNLQVRTRTGYYAGQNPDQEPGAPPPPKR